mgnify:CR=1 FL=1
MSKYDFGGLEKHPANILRLISELEGSYQLCKYMGFGDDMKVLEEMKGRYYKMYFKIKKESHKNFWIKNRPMIWLENLVKLRNLNETI